jgi:hypothetical protein
MGLFQENPLKKMAADCADLIGFAVIGIYGDGGTPSAIVRRTQSPRSSIRTKEFSNSGSRVAPVVGRTFPEHRHESSHCQVERRIHSVPAVLRRRDRGR